ncbi:MAG: hypothetical protein O2910_07475 [Proteobacteria bacterium]|jgi:hypothetical protein|nr:hypothetical protein [Pseudomonadota bacterium]
MNRTKHGNADRQMIAIYAPIFQEKLEKLVARGEGASSEAVRLRQTLGAFDQTSDADVPLIQAA